MTGVDKGWQGLARVDNWVDKGWQDLARGLTGAGNGVDKG